MALIGSTQQLPAQAQLPAEHHADVPTELSAPLAAKVRSRWFSRPVMALTAAAAAVAIIVGGGLIANQLGSTTFVQQQASQLAAINSALDHKQAVAAVSTGGTATLVWSESLGKSALITDGLPALPTGKAYELWYIDAAGTPTPAGMLDAAAGSSTWRVLDGAMAPGDTVGVTVEPRSGSKAPTTTPIVAIPSA
jgi:anti-sigma-K factor RskA